MAAPRQLFGTDGIRGRAGEYPLDAPTLARAGRALAELLGPAPRIVIGNDTRESCGTIYSQLAHGLLAGGADLHYAGVVTTPGVAYLTRQLEASAGVVISASHNPYSDNGIKIFSATGFKFSDAWELDLETLILAAAEVGTDAAGATTGSLPPAVEAALDASYADFLAAAAPAGRPLAGLSVVVDCAHGAAYELAPALFARLGARVTPLSVSPNGRNINDGCGALHPEAMAAAVRQTGAHLGIAFDGDADRCILADELGNIRDGDDILYVWATELARRNELSGNLVVATSMSNIGLELALAEHGIRLMRADVGDKYVLEMMRREGASLGGEQSGHIIDLRQSTSGDGLLTAVVMATLTAKADGSLSRLARPWRRFPQVLKSRLVSRKEPFERLPGAQRVYDAIVGRLAGRGRLVVRYSGTESKVRVMIEGEEQGSIDAWADEYLAAFTADLAALEVRA